MIVLQELDLRNNILDAVPSEIQFFRQLDTLLLSVNKIRTLNGFPWNALEKLTVFSVSDNQVLIKLQS